MTMPPRTSMPDGIDGDDDLTEVERWAFKGLKAARDTIYDPKTGRATGIGTFLPVYAPALDAVADFRGGNYARAGLNAALAVGDAFPLASAGKIFNLGRRIGWGNLVRTDLTHREATKILKKAGYLRPGQEAHHTIRIWGRHAQPNWRTNPLLLKPLARPNHKRLTGRWSGEPQYGLPGKIWYGTNHWQKSFPTGAATYAADGFENWARSPTPPPKRGPR